MEALGAQRTALARGLRVPQDVALAEFGEIEDGRCSTPTLTTVSPGKGETVRVAVEMLERQIHGPRYGGGRADLREVTARHELLVRESTAGR
ncbi:substrate-binding domain-containing protein [Streptomyces sp. NPDC046831]|uniref:substrate-binding domain-containing protein n=1 Tax=Streptomyces sp. NPDC046831 TaxID=3154805 RepID=UPI0033FBF10C